MATVYNKDGIPFDIDALATDVNGKADKDLVNVSSNVSVCIESWHDENGNWYRVYSDGWCEQGGSLTPTGTGSYTSGTITFPKSFKDTNYKCFIMGSGTGDAYTGLTYDKSNSSIKYNHVLSRDGADWECKGYIR